MNTITHELHETVENSHQVERIELLTSDFLVYRDERGFYVSIGFSGNEEFDRPELTQWRFESLKDAIAYANDRIDAGENQ